jgi:hypothetical protein
MRHAHCPLWVSNNSADRQADLRRSPAPGAPPGTPPYRSLKVEQEWMWLGLNDEISAVPVVVEAETLAFEFQKPSHRISFDV